MLRQSTVIAYVLLLAGCAGNVRVMMTELELQAEVVELADTPFYPQITDQCGPSSLATILNVAGVDVTPAILKPSIYIPGRQGSLQLEMLAATRRYGRIPYELDPEISAVLSELRADRPVLVLQNLGTNRMPVWHYAVVVGFLPAENRFILRSGDRKRYRVKAATFLRSWRRADYWALVALKPGVVPDNADPHRYLSALSAIESIGDNATSIEVYAAAVKKWPDYPLAWLGLGNAYYAGGQLAAAQHAYASLLQVQPENSIALNNLAQVQDERGLHRQAADTIAAALSVADVDGRAYPLILQTQQDISQRSFGSRE